MTKNWYMFTPIDLSEDGTQTFDLIAGNMFVIGKVSVTVENGRFQVDYKYNSTKIQSGREYFNIFPDYDSIEEENLENLHAQKRFSYGKSYSIADKLEGDTDVILFVCITATFKKTTSGVGDPSRSRCRARKAARYDRQGNCRNRKINAGRAHSHFRTTLQSYVNRCSLHDFCAISCYTKRIREQIV